jgi:acetyl esterase
MLDPQAQALLNLIAERGQPALEDLPPVEAREVYLQRRFFVQPKPPEVALARDLAAEGPSGPIPLRLFRPIGSTEGATLPVLVYYHGGGFVVGGLDTHDTLCRTLCNLSGCAVVSVDYRMAPEHRFPAAVDDSLAAARWLQRHASDLRIDPNRMAVGGDSAGGNLAAVVAIAARDAGDLPIRFQLLIYPATDQRCGADSHRRNGQGYLLTSASIAYFMQHYLGENPPREDWRCSPLLHPDLSKLPPAFVLVAGYDPLRDEGVEYAQKLSLAGSPAALVSFERQIHGFITMGRVIDEANVAVQLCAAQLKQALAQ